jgi:hypothetical protein
MDLTSTRVRENNHARCAPARRGGSAAERGFDTTAARAQSGGCNPNSGAKAMASKYPPPTRERAELYALRLAVLELLKSVNVTKPGIISELEQRASKGLVSPAQSEDVLHVDDALLRKRVRALVDEAGQVP